MILLLFMQNVRWSLTFFTFWFSNVREHNPDMPCLHVLQQWSKTALDWQNINLQRVKPKRAQNLNNILDVPLRSGVMYWRNIEVIIFWPAEKKYIARNFSDKTSSGLLSDFSYYHSCMQNAKQLGNMSWHRAWKQTDINRGPSVESKVSLNRLKVKPFEARIFAKVNYLLSFNRLYIQNLQLPQLNM